MRIIRLQAEGFKRLVAVDITPEGDLVEIRGNNGNGKSSVLDAIFAALAGADGAPVMPVRDGEEAAVIRLDLGELIVTRYFTAHGTTGLKVTNQEGFEAKSAQTMLDKLVGRISFDPLEFLSLKPSEQAEELRKLVSLDVDLDAMVKANDEDYAARRDVNRDAQSVKSQLDALGGERHVPEDAPDRDALLASMEGASATNTTIERERDSRTAKAAEMDELENDLDQLAGQILEMQQRFSEGKELLATGRELLEKAEPLADPVDVTALREQLLEADRIAENRRVNEQRKGLAEQHESLVARAAALTDAMDRRKRQRATAISQAKMPVEGLALTVDDVGKLDVEYGGVPFSQASDAERLRVAAAVAMAANPELRVLRLKDASLLDKGGVETLRELAKAHDFQIWAEFVGDEGPGIIMEAGEVRGAEAPEPLPKPRQRKKDDGVIEAEASEEIERGELVKRDDDGRISPAVPRETTGSTLFERMAEASGHKPVEQAKPKPQAMTEFNTKPRGDQ